jgi:hypothetical protein
MRRHQQKIWVPLAVLVTIAMVFFGAFTGALRGCGAQDGGAGRIEEMAMTGHHLALAGFSGQVSREQARREVEARLGPAAGDDEKTRQGHGRRIEEEVNKLVQIRYSNVAFFQHYLPIRLARELGISVGDEELKREVRKLVTDYWGIKPFSKRAFLEELEARTLPEWRFLALYRAELIRERLNEAVSAAAGASEADQFWEYVKARRKVQVQYLQRDARDFLAAVKVLPGERPVTPPATVPVDGGDDDTSVVKQQEEDPAALYEGEIKKAYAELIKQIEESAGRKPEDKDFVWPEQLCGFFPELFQSARLGGRYLLAVCKDFEAKCKVTDEEVQKKYDDNREVKYKVTPAPAAATPAPAPAQPEYRPLDAKLKAEIRKELLTVKAADAAKAALDAAVKEHNGLPSEEMTEKKIGELAGKHGLRLESFGPASREDLDTHEHLGAVMVVPEAHGLFEKAKRDELGSRLTAARRLDDGVGYVALRLLQHSDVRLLEFAEAEAGFTYRQKCEKAWRLAEKAVADDVQALREGRIDASRVRLSKLLGPGDETCRMVAAIGLAPGEAVKKAYRYSQLLGPAAEAAEKKRKEKEAAGAGKDATRRRQPDSRSVEERIYDSAYRQESGEDVFQGYRAVVLVASEMPTMDEFRADALWRGQWSRPPLTEEMLRMYRMFNYTPSQPGGVVWRQGLLRVLYDDFAESMRGELE